MTRVKIGLVQMRHEPDVQANINKAKERVQQAAQSGAGLVCLSELFSAQYFCQREDPKNRALAQEIPGPATDSLAAWARQTGIVLIASLYEKAKDHFYNTAVVFDKDGTFLGKYRKVHIPDDLEHYYGERYYFSDGDLGFPVFRTHLGVIGVQVCWDQWYPEGARIMADQGAQILFYPTAIGFQDRGPAAINRAEHEAWQIIQRSHAIANNVFVAACNRVGREGNLDFWGTSFVADPLGRLLAKGSEGSEEIVLADCDLGLIGAVRHDWPFLACRKTIIHAG
jgi:N-carbamoylputrescine amidase